MVLGLGASYFLGDPSGVRDGLDILTGDVALSLGQPPHTAALIAGPLLSGTKVRAALMRLGARAGTVAGKAGLVWGPEGSQNPNAANAFGVGPALGEFDRSVITAHTVLAGRYAADVATLLGGGSSTVLKNPTRTCHDQLSGRRDRSARHVADCRRPDRGRRWYPPASERRKCRAGGAVRSTSRNTWRRA